MHARLRIVQVNAAFEPAIVQPGDLLDRYETLTAWSEAVVAAGAEVTVVQRFSSDARLERNGVVYRFVCDGTAGELRPGDASAAAVAAVLDSTPDLVHVNGLMFPRLVGDLRDALPHEVAIVVQDHAGVAAPSRRARWIRRPWPPGLDRADAVSFTSAAQAVPWHEAGLLARTRVLELVEASTRLTPTPADAARRHTGLAAAPLLLWVGRLNANKDPLTVLDGFERSLDGLPEARLAMVWNGDAPLEPRVRTRVSGSPVLCERVTLIGTVPHDAMPHYFGSADAFVSGSRTEGSGYALIEALASGLAPIVTDIAPFRAIAGPCGFFWRPGDARACARAITNAGAALDRAGALAREHFQAELAWSALGARTLEAYTSICRERRTGVGGP